MEQTRTISMPQYHKAVQVAAHIRSSIAAGTCAGLSIRALCRQFAASETVLTKSFRRWHGISLHAFIIREKMARARALLTHSGDPVCLIAGELGYSEPANFSRDFTRATGLSPLAFRRREWEPPTPAVDAVRAGGDKHIDT